MIEFVNVHKRFGLTPALKGVSISFARGRITGLFGPNGAGKSTTLRLIAGLNLPDKGEVLIEGQKPRQCRDKIAYVPEIDHLYPRWTLGQAASFFRSLYPDWDDNKYRDLISFLDLDEEMTIGKISKGQRAKCKLLLAISRRSPYLLLDEPLSGIDVLTRQELIDTLIRDYREGEQSIIIATHEIAEVENLVDDVVFINGGRITLAGNADELRSEKGLSILDIMKEEFRHVE